MRDEEGIEYFDKKISEVEKGTDWAWWLLIVTVTITMIIALDKILWLT